jgi:two-component system chemotaxis response regulator CheB
VPGPTRRIAVCESSQDSSAALRKYLERDAELEIVGSFETAEELLAALEELNPDLITMDLDLPRMQGLTAIETIMRDRPTPILVIGAHIDKHSQRATEALAAGALDAIQKERITRGDPDDVWAIALRSRVKRLASLRLKASLLPEPAEQTGRRPTLVRRPASVVAIGASTGGPPALLAVLRELPADYPLPVLVVQHIGSGFSESLVSWLQRNASIPVGLAEEGALAKPGVWFAPDDAHLLLDPSMEITFDRETREGAHRPSVDALFTSVAEAAGEEAIGVVLTGMGRDGAQGVTALREAGGYVIAQDEQTAAVFGMPRAAAEAGADLVLPLGEIGQTLGRLRATAVSG